MNDNQYTRIFIHHSQGTSYYTEQEIAEHTHMEIPMIRRLRSVGLLEGIEIAGEEPRYSEEDAVRLRRIRRLHRDLGVNLAGIDIILRLTARLEALQSRVE